MLAVLAMFRRLHFYDFGLFSPCSGAGIFIFFGRFGHIQAVALLSFLAVLAMLRRLHFYYFRLQSSECNPLNMANTAAHDNNAAG